MSNGIGILDSCFVACATGSEYFAEQHFKFQILKIFLFVSHLLGFCGLLENLLFFMREAVQAVLVHFFQDAVNLRLQVSMLSDFSLPGSCLELHLDFSPPLF